MVIPEQDISGRVEIPVNAQLTVGTSEDLVPAQLLVTTSATRLAGVGLIHQDELDTGHLPCFDYQQLSEGVMAPGQHLAHGGISQHPLGGVGHHVGHFKDGQEDGVIFGTEQLAGFVVKFGSQVLELGPQLMSSLLHVAPRLRVDELVLEPEDLPMTGADQFVHMP